MEEPAFRLATFDDEFVGVSWFLWHGEVPAAVRVAAQQLRARFCGFAGEPIEESTTGDDADTFTAFWEVEGLMIDMYLHGGQALGGAIVQDSVVQLHVDHTDRSRRADEAAVSARQDAPAQGE